MIMADNNLRLADLFWGPGPLPTGAVILGNVYRKPGIAGAIIRLPSGLYAQGNAGSLRSVNQTDIQRAIRQAGSQITEGATE